METSNLKPLPNGQGNFGKCYIVDDKTLYKELKYNKDINIKTIKKLVGLKNDTVVFPKKLYEYQDHFGYTMDYIKKKSIWCLKSDIPIDALINNVEKLYNDLEDLANQGIRAQDINPANVLFDKTFNIIDIDFYAYDEQQTQKHNQFQLTSCIKNCILGYTRNQRDEIENFLMANNQLTKIINQRSRGYDKEMMKEYLIELKRYASEMIGQELNSIKEIHEYTRKIKK